VTSGGDVQLYALIGFIPGALGEYLNRVRRELVPGCLFRSHVTVLPPRLLRGSPDELSTSLAAKLAGMEALEIGVGKVEVFSSSGVIYLSIESGREELRRIHEHLVHGVFDSSEQYPFHPHITLAQEFPPEQLSELVARAEALWRDYPYERAFSLRQLCFVRGADLANWEHVSHHELCLHLSPRP